MVKKTRTTKQNSPASAPSRPARKKRLSPSLKHADQEQLLQSVRQRIYQQESVSKLGQMALEDIPLQQLFKIAVKNITAPLNIEFASILELSQDRKALVFRAKYGWKSDIILHKSIVPKNKNSQAWFSLSKNSPVIVDDLKVETRFKGAQHVRRYKVRSGMSAVIRHSGGEPFGVITVQSTKPKNYSEHDLQYLQSVANILGLAIERQRYHEQIIERERKFQSYIEYSTDGFRLVNKKGEITYVSPSIKRILGYSPDEYTSLNLFELIHPDDKKGYRKIFQTALKTPGKSFSFTYRMKHKNGSWRWLEGVGRNLLNEPEVQAVISNFRDITERLEFEQRLRASKDRLQLAVDAADLGIWKWDLREGVLFWDQKLKKQFDLPKDFPVTIMDFYNFIHPEDRKKVQKANQQAVDKRKNFDILFRIVSPLNGNIKWIHSKAQVFQDDDNEPMFIEGVTMDVTPLKETEQRKDEFMNMASHELKTPITSLTLFVELLSRQLTNAEVKQAEQTVSRIKDQIGRLNDIIRDMLDISRVESGKLKLMKDEFYLNQLIEDTVAGLVGAAKRHRLEFIAKDEVKVRADRFRIYQVISNLINNAIKYSPGRDRVEIVLERTDGNAVVSVKDFGIGISKKDQEKIFEKLYQVTQQAVAIPGLGMGLYISKQIIDAHGGVIWVKSTIGKGSTFYFSLPALS